MPTTLNLIDGDKNVQSVCREMRLKKDNTITGMNYLNLNDEDMTGAVSRDYGLLLRAVLLKYGTAGIRTIILYT